MVSGATYVAQWKDRTMTVVCCPSCGQIDQLQKVSSIVSAGTTNTVNQGVAYNTLGRHGNITVSQFSGSSQTELASRLARPSAPQWPSFGGGWVFVVLLSWGIGGTLVWTSNAAIANAYRGDDLSSNFVLLAVGAALVAIGFLTILLRDSYVRKARPNYFRRKKEWDEMALAWDKSFYCYRCDRMFVP